jgi:hypothetical protein
LENKVNPATRLTGANSTTGFCPRNAGLKYAFRSRGKNLKSKITGPPQQTKPPSAASNALLRALGAYSFFIGRKTPGTRLFFLAGEVAGYHFPLST